MRNALSNPTAKAGVVLAALLLLYALAPGPTGGDAGTQRLAAQTDPGHAWAGWMAVQMHELVDAEIAPKRKRSANEQLLPIEGDDFRLPGQSMSLSSARSSSGARTSAPRPDRDEGGSWLFGDEMDEPERGFTLERRGWLAERVWSAEEDAAIETPLFPDTERDGGFSLEPGRSSLFSVSEDSPFSGSGGLFESREERAGDLFSAPEPGIFEKEPGFGAPRGLFDPQNRLP